MSEHEVELTSEERASLDASLKATRNNAYGRLQRLSITVETIIAARLADAEARAEAAVTEAINRARNEHWQKHLREHPYADAKSCPGDYAAHDAYRHAAQVAIEALRGDQ